MARLQQDARRDIVQAISERYAAATKVEKAKILDEFVAITGYHRKHAIRVLKKPEGQLESTKVRSSRPRVYDEAVCEALVVLWEASDRICGKRLKPLLPILVSALERRNLLHRKTKI